jgi:hypothetical protein
MSSVRDSHTRAMDTAFFADRERRQGNIDGAARLFEEALSLELGAIEGLNESDGLAWTVLHRSAGWLALDCNRPRLAEQLACKALSGEPDSDVAEELRDVLKRANFYRHLEPRGLVLSESEVQLNLAGRAVANGVAFLADIVSRMNSFQSLVYRIVQRKLKNPYSGRVPSHIRNSYRVFASQPTSGSFGVSLRLGQPVIQPSLPGFFGPPDVIREFMDLIDLVNRLQDDEIQERIPEEAYRKNFLGLVKNLAPDGDRIRQVSFTTLRGSDVQAVAVTTPSSSIRVSDGGDGMVGSSLVEVSGTLRYADAGTGNRNHNRIRLVDDAGPSHDVIVPEGLMDDIVRPLWNSFVTVRGSYRARQKLPRLIEIWESEPDSGRAVGPVIRATGDLVGRGQGSLYGPGDL